MEALLISFGVIFVAELPDKSLFASLMLGTRLRPLGVWLGVAAAFLIHVVLAVLAGKALTLLPPTLVSVVVAVLFLVGGLALLRRREEEVDQANNGQDVVGRDGPISGQDGPAGGPEMALPVRATAPLWRAVLTSFGVVFIGEMGDITQITTANLAARYGDPWAVGLGAVLALWSAAALAITAGRSLLRIVPLRALQRVAGIALLVLAALSALDAIRG